MATIYVHLKNTNTNIEAFELGKHDFDPNGFERYVMIYFLHYFHSDLYIHTKSIFMHNYIYNANWMVMTMSLAQKAVI